MNQKNAVAEIVRVLMDNPAYSETYGAILEFCRTERDENDVIAYCETQRVSKPQIQSAPGIVSVLVRRGALAQIIFVDEEFYDGGLEGLQTDESVPCDAEIRATLQATEAGLSALIHLQNAFSFDQLTHSCPERIPAFKAVLLLCSEVQGKTTRELQETLRQKNMLSTESDRGIDRLHASYFTSALERIGALIWKGKTWITSEKGLAILES